MIALLLALASTALAQTTVDSPEACPFTPIETPDPVRPADALAPTRDFVECIVTTEVDGQGKPTPKNVEGCEEPFASAARTGFSTWRFEPCVLADTRPVEGTVKVAARFASSEFQLQGDAAYDALMGRHQAGKPVDEGCEVDVRITPDGTILDIVSSDVKHCLTSAGLRTLKHYHLEIKKKKTCTVQMEVKASQADADTATVSGGGCTGDLERYSINAATSFPWNSPIGGSEKYTVRLILGPE